MAHRKPFNPHPSQTRKPDGHKGSFSSPSGPIFSLPLYQGTPPRPSNLPGDAHRGLLWDKFFDEYHYDFGETLDIKEVQSRFVTWIQSKKCGDPQALKVSQGRIQRLVAALGGSTFVAKCDGFFATGLGQTHPTENGFTFHRTLGTPFFSGSAVKGMTRAWMEWSMSSDPEIARETKTQINRWFGESDSVEASAGWFMFFDALPKEPVELVVDVLTPHYGKWYESGGGPLKEEDLHAVVPADWQTPVPSFFLAARNLSFCFGVAVRPTLGGESLDQAQQDLPMLIQAMKEALEFGGAGAKTATGYGRFYESVTES